MSLGLNYVRAVHGRPGRQSAQHVFRRMLSQSQAAHHGDEERQRRAWLLDAAMYRGLNPYWTPPSDPPDPLGWRQLQLSFPKPDRPVWPRSQRRKPPERRHAPLPADPFPPTLPLAA